MSILTFSKAMLDKWAGLIYPELQKRYVVYDNYFKTKSKDAFRTNINDWLASCYDISKEALEQTLIKYGLIGKSYDETMRNILIFVQRNIVYKPDIERYKMDDYWQTPSETLLLQTGDCEDGSVLIICLAKKAGVPTDRYWLQWGAVLSGIGHAYTIYLRQDDAEEVVLDWCFWFNRLVINLRKWFGAEERYGKIWGTAFIK